MGVLAGVAQKARAARERLAGVAAAREEPKMWRAVVNNGLRAELLASLLNDPYPVNRTVHRAHQRLPKVGVWRLVDHRGPQVRFRVAKRRSKVAREGGQLQAMTTCRKRTWFNREKGDENNGNRQTGSHAG